MINNTHICFNSYRITEGLRSAQPSITCSTIAYATSPNLVRRDLRAERSSHWLVLSMVSTMLL